MGLVEVSKAPLGRRPEERKEEKMESVPILVHAFFKKISQTEKEMFVWYLEKGIKFPSHMARQGRAGTETQLSISWLGVKGEARSSADAWHFIYLWFVFFICVVGCIQE